jgi:hypothetical protein
LLDHWDLLPDGVGGLYVAYSWYRDFRTDWVGVQRIYPDGHFGGDTTVAVHDESPILPGNSFQLNNYPNPFNASTVISFYLQVKGRASLFIYDALGNLVVRVMNEDLSPGLHRYIWDTRKLDKPIGSGSYFIRLKVDDSEATRMITFIK